jgi:hypothetical protein
LIFRLPDRTDKALVHINKVYRGEHGQNYLKREDYRIILNSGEVSALKYVREHQELQKYGSA